MKRVINKLILVLLSTLMVVAIATPILAQDATPKTLTITGINEDDNAKVIAYKVIDRVNQVNANNFSHYKWEDKVSGYIKDTYIPIKAGINKGDYVTGNPNENIVSDIFRNLDSTKDKDELENFIGKLANYIEGSVANGNVILEEIRATKNDQDETFVFDNLNPSSGAYIIVIKGENGSIYKPIFYPNILGENIGEDIINTKRSMVSINKSVDADNDNNYSKTDSVQIGDVVKYKVEITLPDYDPYNPDKYIEVKDSLKDIQGINNSGLIFIKDSLSIKNENGDDLTNYFDKIEITDDEIIIIHDDPNILNEGFKGDYNKLKDAINAPDHKIIIEYLSKVTDTKKVEVTTNNTDGIVNTAQYIYNASQHISNQNSIQDSATLFTYGINLTKKAFNGSVEVSSKGAKFMIYEGSFTDNEPKIKPLKFTEDKNSHTYTLLTDQNIQEGISELVIDDMNIFKIIGLDAKEYTMVEIQAPNTGGFTKPNNPNTVISLIDSKTDGNVDMVDGKLDVSSSAKGTNVNTDNTKINDTNINEFDVQIDNFMGDFNIPNTGSTGTMVFTVGGMLLMAGALVIIVISVKNRKNRQ